MALDQSGSVFISGLISSAVDFGGGTLVPNFVDMFMAKYDQAGVHQWSKIFNEAWVTEMATDLAGNVIICGDIYASVDFGGGPVTGTGGGYMAKFNPAGAHVWSRRFLPHGARIAVDPSGNIFATGQFLGTTNLGGSTLISHGMHDAWLAKFDPNSVHIWSKALGGTMTDGGFDVATDALGRVTVTGYAAGTTDFGGGPLTGPEGIFLARFDGGGVHQWSRRMGGAGDDLVEEVSVNATGAAAIAGYFNGATDMGGGPMPSVGGYDGYVAQYAADGTYVSSRSFGAAEIYHDHAYAISVDPVGSVVVTGDFAGSVDFGGGMLTSVAATPDIFVASYDATGAHLWSVKFGGTDNQDVGFAIGKDPSSNLFLAGGFGANTDFGGGPLTSGGFTDIFMAKFGDLPVPVLFSFFDAVARKGGVDLRWDISTDEALQNLTLYRSEGDDSPFQAIANGDPLAIRSFRDAHVLAGNQYRYQLVIESADGELLRSPIVTVQVPVLSNSLDQNHPNPFNPSTTITYTLAERTSTAIAVYDAKGALVVRLDEGEHDAGMRSVAWNGRDAAGMAVASGVYFYRLEGVRDVAQRRMVLLK